MSALENEEWRPVLGYEGLYEVSNLGRVRSMERTIHQTSAAQRSYIRTMRGVMRKPVVNRSGHLTVSLAKDGKQNHHYVHKLVLESFIGPRPEGMEACHSDGDPSNNVLTNLRWDTRSENNKDRVRHGTHNTGNAERCKRGHRLVAPNLYETYLKIGRRQCKSCTLALAAQRRGATTASTSPDDHYLRIMGVNPGSWRDVSPAERQDHRLECSLCDWCADGRAFGWCKYEGMETEVMDDGNCTCGSPILLGIDWGTR